MSFYGKKEFHTVISTTRTCALSLLWYRTTQRRENQKTTDNRFLIYILSLFHTYVPFFLPSRSNLCRGWTGSLHFQCWLGPEVFKKAFSSSFGFGIRFYNMTNRNMKIYLSSTLTRAEIQIVIWDSQSDPNYNQFDNIGYFKNHSTW